MGKTNENYVKILPEDNKTVIQDKLFKIFSKIYTNLEKEKFQLYQMNESDSPSLYADDYNFLYNIHYSGKSIKFEKLTDMFWKIECAGFSSTMVNLESKYWPSAIYLYSNETGKIACYTERQMFDIDVLSDENFNINDDGTSNYIELYKKSIKNKEEKERLAAEAEQLKIKQEEEKRKKEIEELKKKEDNCTVTESAIIKFDYYSNLNENVIKKEINNIVENDFNCVDINIERISFYNRNSEHYYNNEASLHVIFKSEQSYPFTTVKNKINNLDVELSGLILHDNFEVDYNTKRFKTEKDAQDYVKIIEKREKKQEEILDNLTKENENQTESFDMMDQLDQEDDYISDTLESDDETEVQELVDIDETETNILESEQKEEYEFKTEVGKVLNEKRKILITFLKKNNLILESDIEFSYDNFDIKIKKIDGFDFLKCIDLLESEKFTLKYFYNYSDYINICISKDSQAFKNVEKDNKETDNLLPPVLITETCELDDVVKTDVEDTNDFEEKIPEEPFILDDFLDNYNPEDETWSLEDEATQEDVLCKTEKEKYLMLKDFIKKHGFKLVNDIDIQSKTFICKIKSRLLIKYNNIQIKNYFEDYGHFTVESVISKKTYFEIKIDKNSKYFDITNMENEQKNITGSYINSLHFIFLLGIIFLISVVFSYNIFKSKTKKINTKTSLTNIYDFTEDEIPEELKHIDRNENTNSNEEIYLDKEKKIYE